jgi:DNA-damage-inducible protein D
MTNLSSFNTSSNESPFDAVRRFDEYGNEYWVARELMSLLGYSKWQRFEDAISRAMIAATNSKAIVDKHFTHLPGSVSGSGGLPNSR